MPARAKRKKSGETAVQGYCVYRVERYAYMSRMLPLLRQAAQSINRMRNTSPRLEEVERDRLVREEKHVEETDGHGNRPIRGGRYALPDRVRPAARLGLHHRILFRLSMTAKRFG